jgi:hypothetical protein
VFVRVRCSGERTEGARIISDPAQYRLTRLKLPAVRVGPAGPILRDACAVPGVDTVKPDETALAAGTAGATASWTTGSKLAVGSSAEKISMVWAPPGEKLPPPLRNRCSQTPRWREMDSNFRFPAMVSFVVVPFRRVLPVRGEETGALGPPIIIVPWITPG